MPEPLYHEEFGTLDLNSLPAVTKGNVSEGSLLVVFSDEANRFRALIWLVHEMSEDKEKVNMHLIKVINSSLYDFHEQWVTLSALNLIGYRVLS
jgi:hypothetical protein